MTKINIEIDLAHLGMDVDEDGEPMPGPGMQDLIVHNIVERMGASIEGDIRERVNVAIDERVAEALEKVVQEVVDGPVQRYKRWGDKDGDPTSVREIVREHVEKFMAKPLTRDPWDRDRRPDSLPDIVAVVTKDVLTKELTAEVRAARQQVNDTVKNTIVTETIKILNGDRL
jgi:hypothetical protein